MTQRELGLDLGVTKDVHVIGIDFAYRNVGIASIHVSSRYCICVSESCVNENCKIEFVKNHALVRDCYTVSTRDSKDKESKSKKLIDGSKYLHRSITDLISQYKNVSHIFIEMPYGSQSNRSAVGMGVCYGVVASMMNDYIDDNINVEIVTPSSAKKFACRANATKKEMIESARYKYPNNAWMNTNLDEHMADAIWVGLAGYWEMLNVKNS